MPPPAALAARQAPPAGAAIDAVERAHLAAAMDLADQVSGRLSQQGKFPAVPQLEAPLHTWERRPTDELGRFLVLTLEQMAALGLHDLIGGGFFRYTVDPG